MQYMETPIFEPILRTIIVFLVVLLIARILGRKQISQLTFFDYVVGTTIGSLAASAMSNNFIPLSTDLLCFITWTILIIILHTMTQRSQPAKKLLNSQPLMVIHNGKILESNLTNSYYTTSDLLAQLREKEIFDPNIIEVGILETNGQLSILKKAEHQTLTAKDLNITKQNISTKQYTGKELVVNGQIIQQNLSLLNISETWLQDQLKLQGVTDINDITLAILTPDGKIYLDRELDHVK